MHRPAASSSPPEQSPSSADALIRPSCRRLSGQRVPAGGTDPAPCGCARSARSSPRARRAAAGSPPGRQASPGAPAGATWVPGAPRPPGPGCPDAGATLPVAARRPRRGHAPPEPKKKARYKGRRAGWRGRRSEADKGMALGTSAQCPVPWAIDSSNSPTLQMGRLRPQGHPLRKTEPSRLSKEGRSWQGSLTVPTPSSVARRKEHGSVQRQRAGLEGTGTRAWS